MPSTVTVLCDNESAHPACAAEWGLCLAIETGTPEEGGDLWLWDAGQTGLFLSNARALGLEPARAAGLALSHGHYDHTGGLAALMEAGFRGGVHAHPCCALPRYAEEKNGKPRRPIGPPAPLPPFFAAAPVTRLAPGLTLLTDIPRAPGRFQAVAGFSLDPQGQRPDHVPDDSFLVLESPSGPVAILGCCHSGLANSLDCAAQRLGLDGFHAVLGGLHLYNAGPGAIQETAEAIRSFGVRLLAAGHCTGREPLRRLRAMLPGLQVRDMAAGQRLSF